VKVYNKNNIKLLNTDCLKLLKTLDDNSIDLIATDPPYYKVKTDDWDNQWPTKDAFFAWLNTVLIECQRVLKPSGSIYLFCGPHLAAETELLIGQYFKVLNHIVWRKPSGRHLGCNKEYLTKYFHQTERIIFAESTKYRAFNYERIRSHLANTIRAAGVTSKHVNDATNTQMSGHWFSVSQFHFPSRENYKILHKLAPSLKPYDKLRAEYMAIRKKVSSTGRKFAVTKHVPYTDVWDFGVVQPYKGKHPCEKPLDIMEHIIATSSNPNDTVLDPFTGSGSTPIAAKRLGREFIGSEMGEKEYNQAIERLEKETPDKA